ncbi:putative short-chain dehydrogenase [Hyaloscypha hepaticicola]|uniref:Putative short-chain dehydrogenase n=1 Tax=Hyaloscypha hepaticicola TaxID=2082293 RepID=A0A2J6PFM8_9HELO|nr:putative short-chain dehydrogenase [Hyaloscypha hepaticicola]
MPSISPVILILGAGPNIGQSCARAFAAKGYRVAVASRNNTATADQLHIQSDFSKHYSVIDAFATIKRELGTPSVVVYNAAAVTFTPPKDPLSTPLESFINNLNINTTSAFVAAQQAALGFAELPETASKTFLYTCNILNEIIIPPMLDAGVGKSGAAHMIRSASEAYKEKGFKLYYCDERKADGGAVYGAIDGDASAKHYVELSEGKTQRPWQQTFVKGARYKAFPSA